MDRPLPQPPSHAPRPRIPRRPLLALAAVAAAVAAVLPPALGAQEGPPPDTAEAAVADTARQGGRVRVYLDCPRWACDFDYVREQIPYVDWVRRRQAADLHVLVTEEDTGGGGSRFTLDIIGRGEFEGSDRRLRYASGPTATEAAEREGLTRRLALGLMPYVARTAAADRIRISFEGSAGPGPEAGSEREDGWDHWVFRTRVGGFLSGESRRRNLSLSGSVSADRTTRALKVDLGLNGSLRESRFQVSDTSTFTSVRRSGGMEALVVKSVGPHWSVGGRGSLRSSTFLNQDRALRLGPAIEYSLYPYDEANRRQLTALYSVSTASFAYDTLTVLGQTAETRLQETLNVSLDLQQPWGEVGLSAEGSHYFHDIERYALTLSGDVELQVVEGLSLNFGGRASRVQDQIYLPASEATEEEVLVGERALETDFDYFLRFGFSYTFGSVYSNVVNQRFDSIDGGQRFF